MQTDLAVEHTGILDVLGLQLDLLLIDGCACQLSQSIGNFLAGDFAVQTAGCTALGLDGHGLALDLCGQILGSSYGLSLVEIGSSFLAAGNVHSAGICHSGQLAREQIVAGVAVGDLVDLVLLANALDILLENHFHDSIPHFSPENRCSCCVYSIAHLSLLGKRKRLTI